MVFTLQNLADHPDADLLAMIARNTDQLDRATIARNNGHDEAVRVVKGFGREWVDTDDRIARTPAKTLDGLLSKAAYAFTTMSPPRAALPVSVGPPCRPSTTCLSCSERADSCRFSRPSPSLIWPVSFRC